MVAAPYLGADLHPELLQLPGESEGGAVVGGGEGHVAQQGAGARGVRALIGCAHVDMDRDAGTGAGEGKGRHRHTCGSIDMRVIIKSPCTGAQQRLNMV